MMRYWITSALAVSASCVALAQAPPADGGRQALVKKYCIGCHNNQLKTAGVSLQGLDFITVGGNAEVLEKVLRKVKTGQMPPAGLPRPDAATIAPFQKWLETSLDAEGTAHPNPGRPAIHRLNRAEYSNAVRDVFDLDINAGSLLPVDDSGYGFDNIGDVLSVSSTLLDRYLSVARKVSRLVVGDPSVKPAEEIFEPRRESNRGNEPVPARLDQINEDLPFNSAGGLSVPYYFPVDAEYLLKINLAAPAVAGPGGFGPYEVRMPIKAGLHTVAVTFPRESVRPEISAAPGGRGGGGGAGRGAGGRAERPVASMDMRMDGAPLKRFPTPGNPGGLPRITNLTISGPFNVTGPGDTASRRKVLICKPTTAASEATCASQILSKLSRRAYRRPVTTADVKPLLALYQRARTKGSFEYGIQKAIEGILISPDFLYRVETAPAATARAAAVHRVTPIDLASRLSFFLWSSVPDDELLTLAETGRLTDRLVLKQQVQRMLDDPKADALISNFAGQWLHIRNLATARPDPFIFAEFDESLRVSMQRETELFFESILRENRPALDLISADYTFLNERLAKHYGIPKIYGPQFRRVTLTDPNRGGLLGQASLLTVTSPPNRTSVVQRGKWILENLLGAPPPPPPPDVPSLEVTSSSDQSLTLRQALEKHRGNSSCASCHAIMDPLGFALENYNGIGQWRTKDGENPIDSSGKMPDGTQFSGPAGLRKLIATSRRSEFASAFVERLLTYALGRGVEYYDQPAIRAAIRENDANGLRVRDLIASVVMSTPFQMRRSVDR